MSMGFYVQESLGRGERIVRFARFHWIYDIKAAMMVFWGVAATVAALWAAVYAHQSLGLCPAPEVLGWWGCAGSMHIWVKLGLLAIFTMGLLSALHMIIIRMSTEIAVTTRRLIYKTGLVRRLAEEINIDRVEGVTVSQGFLARILGYGNVVVRGMGVGELVLPTIAEPVTFRKAIQWAKAKAEERKDRGAAGDDL